MQQLLCNSDCRSGSTLKTGILLYHHQQFLSYAVDLLSLAAGPVVLASYASKALVQPNTLTWDRKTI